MYVLSQDVTDPTKPSVVFDHIQKNEDGSSSLIMPDGSSVEQEPNQHGVFGFRPKKDGIAAYGRVDVEGPLVAWQTRPGDKAFVYTIKRLP
jgi:hypothetical protein